MVTRRLLEAEQGKLLIDVDPRECRLVLVRGRRVDDLGHETYPGFVDKFRKFLDGNLDLPRNRHGDGFEWQSLGFQWAPYRFLFGRCGEHSRVLTFWDAQIGEPLGELELSADEAARWSAQLRDLLDYTAGAIDAPEPANQTEGEIDLRLFAECLRERDLQAFRGFAQRHECVIVLCVPDPLARQFIGREGFVPQPPNLHAAARQSAPNAGLLAADPQDAELTQQLAGVAPPATFEDHVHRLATAGFRAGSEADGYALRDALGNRYYTAYRLHGVYDAEAARNLWSPSSGGALWREMNTRLGVDLIQLGPIDQSENVIESDNAGAPLEPQPPVLAFEPDGRVRALLDAREMRSYYEAHGFGWPYSKRLADWESDF